MLTDSPKISHAIELSGRDHESMNWLFKSVTHADGG